MKNTTFFKLFSLVIFSIVFVSCDKDYNTIGADIVGNANFNFTHEIHGVKTYNQKIPVIQTNNLPINQLGIYNDAVGAVSGDILGKVTANFVTQLSLVTSSPTFNTHVEIDSVVLTVPYFSTSLSADANGHNIYRLDSIYNSSPTSVYDPINLKVFRSDFELLNFDGSEASKYYSNQDADFALHNDHFLLNNMVDIPTDNVDNENSAFVPSNREIINFKVTNMMGAAHTLENVDSRFSPRMRLHLDTSYFKTNIIEAPASVFFNDSNFKKYFKGLYFQVQDAASGSLMMLNFAKGDVTIYYKQDVVNTPGATPSSNREMKTFLLKMTGNTVNLLNNTDNATYSAAASNPNNYQSHADRLYLKGGQGSAAYIELFSNPGELQALKDRKVLLNDATLTFTVDNSNMTNKYRHPQRIYVYDADRNIPVIDYYVDNSVDAANFKLNKYIYSGIKKTDNNGVITYKVKITQFVDKILKEDRNTTKENVRLAVVVSENINLVSNALLKLPLSNPISADKPIDRFPTASVMNPFGTVFYGTNSSVPVGKAVKFEIYYTKPN